MKKETKKQILFALYVSLMLIVNVLGTKISSVFGIRVSVGIVFMPFLFCISDIVSECFGKEEAKLMVDISTAMIVLWVVGAYVAIKMPANQTWDLQSEYALVLHQSLRMSIASFVSFFISQRLDVFIFYIIRTLTGSRFLFIRNIVSTVVSQFFDTVIFMFAAFYKIAPQYTFAFVFSLVIPYWLFKMAVGVLETPFCYLGVWWCGK